MTQTIGTTTIPAPNPAVGRIPARSTAPTSRSTDTFLASRGPKAYSEKTKPTQLKKSARRKEAGSQSEITKSDIVLKKLRLVRGVTIAQMVEATGWQAHSVRGFLSAVVRKKLGLDLVSEIGKDGLRRYRIVERGGETE